MRAFVIVGPGRGEVLDVPAPWAAPGEVVVDVERAGVCGTDVEFFTGEMPYLHDGHARFPVRIGHEWCGTVREVGDGVDPSWLGARVTGDTMLGCGRCARCTAGLQHVCDFRAEVGIRDGRPGALAEQLAVPASSLHRLPAGVDAAAGALVEPGGNALRAARAAGVAAGERLLVAGPGTIGLLTALFARAAGADVHLLGVTDDSLAAARGLGFVNAWTDSTLPPGPWHAVIDCSNGASVPARAVDLVEPGRRVVFIGLSGTPSPVDSRRLALKDVTAVGVLSASPGLGGAIAAYADGSVDPRPVVGAVVGLDQVAAVLAGQRPDAAGDPTGRTTGTGRTGVGPKVHIDPRATS